MLLLYLLFAALLLGIVRKLRAVSLGGALALTVLPLALTGPALLTGRIYAPLDLHFRSQPLEALRQDYGLDDEWSRSRHDLALELIPWRKATRFAIENGEWPLWNPFILAGDVLAAAAQPAVYHPVNVMALFLPLAESLTFVAAAVLFTAGFSMFLFCRELGCRESAALAGAAGWMFCGMIVFWMGWPLAMVLAVFPALVHAVRRIVKSPDLVSTAYLTAVLSWVLLGGHPETAFQTIAVAAAYGTAELAAAYRARAPAEGRAVIRLAKPVGFASLAGLLALAVAAIDLLPLLEAVPQTALDYWRSAIVVNVSVPWATAFERLRLFLVPYAYGLVWSEPLRSAKFGAYWYAHVGSVLLAPAVFGCWRGGWRGRWWLLGAAGVGLLFFSAAPGLTDLSERLPLFELTINRRLVFVTGFAVSVLAALGVEAWAKAPGEKSLGRLHVGVAAVLVLATALFWPGLREDGLSVGLLREQALLELVPVALAAVLFATVRSVRLVTVGLLVLLVGQRTAQVAELNPTYERKLLAPAVEPFQVLPQEDEPYRVTGLRDVFSPNVNTLYELEEVRGSSPMANARFVETMPLWAVSSLRRRHVPKVHGLDSPFLSFLNVRYAFVEQRRHAGARKKTTGWKPVHRWGRFVIYENPRVLPRAFVPRRVMLVAPGDEVVEEMAREKNFARRAWIEIEDPEEIGERRDVRNATGTVRTKRRGGGLDLDVEMEEAGWVVVSQTAWKGWRAFEEGLELPLRIANHAFLAIHVPEGRHRLELVYRPRSFVLGRTITFVTTGGLLLFFGAAALGNLRVVPKGDESGGRSSKTRTVDRG